MDNRPIGVFDSGLGGLTVLEKLYKYAPFENYIYLADQKNCPYGTKEENEVRNIVIKNCIYLEKLGCKEIIIACNTASLFIEDAKKICKIPVISVIEPTGINACATTKNGKIGVIATDLTIKKGRYQKIIEGQKKRAFCVPCSEFVDYIENDITNIERGRTLVKEKLTYLKEQNIDTLIYGCTHFSLMEDLYKELFDSINYIDCGDSIKEIAFEKIGKANRNEYGKIDVIASSNAKEFSNKTKWFKINISSIKEI